MFEKIFNAFIVKTTKKSGITVMSAKREINQTGNEIKRNVKREWQNDAFWESRGRTYAALFTSVNGRTF